MTGYPPEGLDTGVVNDDMVREIARNARAVLEAHEPFAISFAPGNGSRYDMAFVPVRAMGEKAAKRLQTGDEYVVVALVNFGTSYTFDLVGRHAEYFSADYVAEKLTRGNQSDGACVGWLLTRISEERPVAVRTITKSP